MTLRTRLEKAEVRAGAVVRTVGTERLFPHLSDAEVAAALLEAIAWECECSGADFDRLEEDLRLLDAADPAVRAVKERLEAVKATARVGGAP